MRVLLSAYACEPDIGSEPGVGWHWALEIARLGHEVWVLTRSNNREPVERALLKEPVPGLHFLYYDLPFWLRFWKKGGRGIRIYYAIWQLGAYRFARAEHRQFHFDLVHHLTFTHFRQPSFMGRLGIPFLLGPLAGGETAPDALRRTLPPLAKLKESLRDFANLMSRLDPMVRRMYKDAEIILCKTEDTMNAVPRAFQGKCRIQAEIGIGVEWLQQLPSSPSGSDFIIVSRLLGWKGIHLALEGLAIAQRRIPSITLSIVGKGMDAGWLKRRAVELGVIKAVHWLGHVPQPMLRELYRDKVAMVFPSLHDSGGSVLLEAAARGLPTICLDLGGPGILVSEEWGIKIPVKGRSAEEVVQSIATAMEDLATNPGRTHFMQIGALRAAKESSWAKLVQNVYGGIEEEIIYLGKS